MARRFGRAAPENHCALNVALYGRPGGWAMTERGRDALARDASSLAIGPSSVVWDGAALTITIRETGAPLPFPIRGTVKVHPSALTGARFTLDQAGRHRWSPIAPVSRVEVALDRPGLRWSGPGYLDTNNGDRPLEADFLQWDWCRAPMQDGAAILYNAERREGGEQSLALKIGADGQVAPFDAPPRARLPGTLWRLGRQTRAEPGSTPRVAQTLTDSPFYARSVIETRLLGENVTAVHESLDMRRFTAPWVQAMLPFRTPRWR
jgi:carotenoid 1,2-hydratase